MGSLENTLILARTAGQALTKVQGPLDIDPTMALVVQPQYTSLCAQGSKDQWWDQIVALYEDCIKETPQRCNSLADYAKWAEHLYRFWSTALSAREMVVTWAGTDPTKQQCSITPTNLLSVRNINAADFPQGKDPTMIEQLGNETRSALQRRGIDCFVQWDSWQYRNYFLRNTWKTAKAFHHQDGPAFVCGFYAWSKKSPTIPATSSLIDRSIGKEILRIRTLWQEEIIPDRVAFRPLTVRSPTVTEEEGAIRIALDLIQASINTKLPLTLPKKKP